MPTFTKFDGLSIQLEKRNGFLVVRLVVPRGDGLPLNVLSEAEISIEQLLEPDTN
jgi:NAD-dependent DNA ligase